MRTNVMGYVEFHCVVVEKDGRCARHHMEPYVSMEERQELSTCGYICDEHQKMYSWLTRLTGIVDESATLGREILNDPVGARTSQFRTGGKLQLVDGKEKIVGATVNDQQKKAGVSGASAIKGWTKVAVYPEYSDVLMIRVDEAKDPQAEFTERKVKTSLGIAVAPPTEEDPFGGRLDEK